MPPDAPPAGISRPGSVGGRLLSHTEWSALLRRLERKKRQSLRDGDGLPTPVPDYFVKATWSSFCLDGHAVSESEAREALSRSGEGPVMLRSRQAQRLRCHCAILHRIENDLSVNLPLTTDGVIRWYTGISAGLSTTALDQATLVRVEDVVRRINTPQLRLQAAIREIAQTHLGLLCDPLVPSFNGILARLLLRFHLGKCRLPAVIFDPATDQRSRPVDALIRRLLELLERSFDDSPGPK